MSARGDEHPGRGGRSPRALVRAVPPALRGRVARPGRGQTVADLRRVFPDLPRTPTRRDLEGRADRLLQRAATHELAREGIELVDRLVDLPAEWTRSDLVAARIPELPSFEAFVVSAASAPRIRVLQIGAADALANARAEASSDAFGITLEAAGDAASFLLTRTWDLLGADGTDAGSAEEYLQQRALHARTVIRETLTRGVSVPQELRVARDHAEQVAQSRAAREQVAQSRAAREGRGGDADSAEHDVADASAAAWDHEAFGAPAPTAGDGAAQQASAEEPDSPAAGSGTAQDAPRRSFADRARSVQDFLQSDAGRSARDFLRSDAGKATAQYMMTHGKDAAAVVREMYGAAQRRSGSSGRGSTGKGSTGRGSGGSRR